MWAGGQRQGPRQDAGNRCTMSSSDSVQSVACDIWTYYATQNRCTVLLIFGVVCGLDWQCGWTRYTTQDLCTMPQPLCILCSLFCQVYWWCINRSVFVQPLVQTQRIQEKKKNLTKNRKQTLLQLNGIKSNLHDICCTRNVKLVLAWNWNCTETIVGVVYDGEPEIRVRQSCNLPIKPSYHHHTNSTISNHHTTTLPYQTIIPPPYHIRTLWYTIIDTSDGHQLPTQNTVSPDLPNSH